MKIVAHSTAAPHPASADIHALKMEVSRLKEEVAALRTSVPPSPVVKQDHPPAPVVIHIPEEKKIITPVLSVTPAPVKIPAPAPQRSPQDPLFARLWTYLNTEK